MIYREIPLKIFPDEMRRLEFNLLILGIEAF